MQRCMTWSVAMGLLLSGCAESGSGPSLQPIPDQFVGVGDELIVQLWADDPDGDPLTYSFASSLASIDQNASMVAQGDGSALFRWIPGQQDIGVWTVDFSVSDGSSVDTLATSVEVGAGVASAPMFQLPEGNGETHDVVTFPCLDLDVAVTDIDDATVRLSDQSNLGNATFQQNDGLTATWHWCPNESQIVAGRHVLTFTADDGSNPVVSKSYLVTLDTNVASVCEGVAPVVEHAAQGLVSQAPTISIRANIYDDIGLSGAPQLFYSFEAPAEPLDLRSLIGVEMVRGEGDEWIATVPNPSAQSGQSAQLWYVIVVSDADVDVIGCSHRVTAPLEGTYEIEILRGADCVDDGFEDNDTFETAVSLDYNQQPLITNLVTCGEDEDWFLVETIEPGALRAVAIGEGEGLAVSIQEPGNVIFAANGRGSNEVAEACLSPGLYRVQVTSSEASEAYSMAVSFNNECPSSCEDDDAEPDDPITTATVVDIDANSPSFTADRILCSTDEDLYRLDLPFNSRLAMSMEFSDPDTDLDFHLLDENGVDQFPPCTPEIDQCLADFGQTFSNPENAVFDLDLFLPTCGDPCTLYVSVRGYDGSSGPYSISLEVEPG